jgi:hypothetical protein
MEDLMYGEDIIVPIDSGEIDNWDNIRSEYEEGGTYRSTLQSDGDLVGSPSSQNCDSVAYNRDVVEGVNSWGVVYDEEWQGRTAVLDDYANTPHHTAMYLDQNNMADIQGETSDPTPYSDLRPGDWRRSSTSSSTKRKPDSSRRSGRPSGTSSSSSSAARSSRRTPTSRRLSRPEARAATSGTPR